MFSIKKLQNVIADWWKTRVNLSKENNLFDGFPVSVNDQITD
jgi:hypothetical protein